MLYHALETIESFSALKYRAEQASFRVGRFSQGSSLDLNGNASMLEAIQHGIHHILGFEEIIPFVILKICGDDGSLSGEISFGHELEEAVHLLAVQGQIPHLIL